MISYEPFWTTLENSTESTYTLIKDHNISSNTINRLRKGLGITTMTIDDLCRILHCQTQDIISYEEDSPKKA